MRGPSPTVAHYVPKTHLHTGDALGLGAPSAAFKQTIINTLRVPVTMVSRRGIRAKYPGSRASMGGALVVLEEQEFQYSVNLDTSDLLSDYGQSTSDLSKQIIETLGLEQRPRLLSPGLPHRVSICHTITLEDFHRNGGSLYVPSLDMVFSLRELEHAPPHPYASTTMRDRIVEQDAMLTHTAGLHYHIRIMDRARQFGERYINLNGAVYQVPVVTEGDYQDGIYVISTHPYQSGSEFPYPRADYYQFEGAEELLHLYRTSIDAATLGDPQSAYKRQLEVEKHNNQVEAEALRQQRARQEHEFEMVKHSYEQERAAAKAEHARREEILAAMERDSRIREEGLKRDTLFAKEQFERESMRRKLHLELLKYGPAVVTGTYLIYKAIVKLQAKK
jgi:hypothetical protein